MFDRIIGLKYFPSLQTIYKVCKNARTCAWKRQIEKYLRRMLFVDGVEIAKGDSQGIITD